MSYSFRVEQAIRAAAMLHRGQTRRGVAPYPYITHLVSVAWLAADYTDDEDVLIACLLHDTVEDTDYTLEELEEDFGRRVREFVAAVTQPSLERLEPAERWRAQREYYVSQLKEAPEEALIVSAADKIHSMRSVVEEYYGAEERFREEFGGTLDERLAAYQGIGNVLNSRLENGIVHEFNHVFEEYKQFIRGAQKGERRR